MPSKLQQLALELEQELNLRVNEAAILPQLEKTLIDKGHMLPEQAGNTTCVRDAMFNVIDMVEILTRDRDKYKHDFEYYRKSYHELAYGPQDEVDEDEPEQEPERGPVLVEGAAEPPQPEMPVRRDEWWRDIPAFRNPVRQVLAQDLTANNLNLTINRLLTDRDVGWVQNATEGQNDQT